MLDSLHRCIFCNHYYRQPEGGPKQQLQLDDIPGVGLVCARCQRLYLNAHWPQLDSRGYWIAPDRWWWHEAYGWEG